MTSFKRRRWTHGHLPDEERLVWVDLEMTGLDIDTCHIMEIACLITDDKLNIIAEMTGLDIDTCHIVEIACLITDDKLNIIAEGPNIIIHQPDEVLEKMDSWCTHQHGKSGLTEESRKSEITLQAAEMLILSFVRQHTPPGKCPLAGNSVHADKKFLDKYMPELMKHLHYRIVDVSTIKELCRRWYPEEYNAGPKKKAAHRALDDIKASINELKYYRKAIFK